MTDETPGQLPTALVTGTSRGLGKAIATDFAKDHRVVGVARGNWEDEKPGHVEHLAGVDLADMKQLEALAPRLAECDILINNAAIAYDGILATQGAENIKQLLDVNLYSVIYLSKLFVRERLAVRKPGVVITIGSIVANRGYRGLAVYSATKGALTSLTQSMAREMGSKGFRFNVVQPGFIETEMSHGLDAKQLEQIVRRTPLGRLGQADDVVPMVRFLASSAARFITGHEFVVDGGLTA
ncbi:MAG: SDR family oxidoreductase [Planctomycetota bacterium]